MLNQQTIENLETVWSSLNDLCSDLDESQWKTPTDCPGWSVQDQLSHIIGSEASLLGRPRPDHEPPEVGHIRNELGARNEVVVDWRRPLLGAKVLEEFREVTAERVKALRAMTEADFEVEAQSPIGRGTVYDALQIRIFDAWVHEQDIRRAVGRPGHQDGPVAEHGFGRVSNVMPYVVGKKAGLPDGSTAVFEVVGPVSRTFTVGVQEGRAAILESTTDDPSVSLAMDTETFICLGCGRWDPEGVLSAGKVTIAGDLEMGKSIIRQMNFMV